MIKKVILLLSALCVGSLSLAACNTIQGAGTDVEKAGAKVSQEAQEHKRY